MCYTWLSNTNQFDYVQSQQEKQVVCAICSKLITNRESFFIAVSKYMFKVNYKSRIWFLLNREMYSEPSPASKMEFLTKIVNG